MHVTEASRIWVRLTVARTQGQVHIRLSSNLKEWSSRVVNNTIQQKPESDDVINCCDDVLGARLALTFVS